MKKTMRYFSPIVVTPMIFLIATLLENTEASKPIVPFVLFPALLLLAVAVGILSPLKTRFDYVMTAIVPISVFFSLFICLFFDEGCDGTAQLSLNHALNIEYYRSWLPIALVMMILTFVFSFRTIRDSVKNAFLKKPE